MNNLEQTLSKILQKAIELAEQTGELVIQQGTELLQQFFLWHTVEYIFQIGISILLVIIAFKSKYLFGNKEAFTYDLIDSWGDKLKSDANSVEYLGRHFKLRTDEFVFMYIIRYTFLSGALILFLINLYWLLFILVAPKLYLLEYYIN